MSVTVAIPTLLQRGSARRTVESALESASVLGEGAEVLVVVNGPAATASSDELDGISSPLLRVLRIPRPSAPGARNAALEAARNDTILFSDDDCVLPRSWCSQYRAALRDGRFSLIGAPVRIEVIGALTAFIDYQRLLDAPPDGHGGVRYEITANCGLRRDLLPSSLRFNDIDFNNASEDTDFGLTLRAAGHDIGWLDNVVSHRMSESIDEITMRFFRYGRGHPRLYTRSGHNEGILGGALHAYERMAFGADGDFRRFSEVTDERLRSAFTAFDLALHSSFLLGYLTELGEELSVPLVRADPKAFFQAFREIAGGLEASVPERLGIDYAQLGRGPAAHTPVPAWFPALLREHAPPVDTGSSEPKFIEFAARAENTWRERRAFFSRVRDDLLGTGMPPSDAVAAERRLRAAGATFREGWHEVEILERESDRERLRKKAEPRMSARPEQESLQ